LLAGGIVLVSLILMGGELSMFADAHAAIVIFGGSFSATLIRFPLSSIFHGLPLGARFAFTIRRITQRELVDEIAGLAEIARKHGPIVSKKSKRKIRSWQKAFASLPTAMTTRSFATISSAIATIFSPISTKVRKSIVRSATALRPSG